MTAIWGNGIEVTVQAYNPTGDAPKVQPTKRGEETKRALVDAAFHLIRERPFSEVTILDICHQAAASTSSFHHLIGKKDDLLPLLFDSMASDAAAISQATLQQVQAATSLEDAVTYAVDAILNFQVRYTHLLATFDSRPRWERARRTLDQGTTSALVSAFIEADSRLTAADRPHLVFIARVVSGSLGPAIRESGSWVEESGLNVAFLSSEYARMACAYLESVLEQHGGDRSTS